MITITAVMVIFIFFYKPRKSFFRNEESNNAQDSLWDENSSLVSWKRACETKSVQKNLERNHVYLSLFIRLH